MEELSKRPSEEIYEVEFSGQFIPDKFNPLWFASKKLLGTKEANEAEIINIFNGQYCAFRTNFIEVYVEPDRFRILTKNLNSYDLVNDMAISIAKILKDTFYDAFFINLKLHYSFNSEEELSLILNKLYAINDWKEIFDKPQLLGIRINEISNMENYKTEKLLSMFPCERADMENTVHIYIKNQFLKTNTTTSLVSILEENSESVNSHIKFANKIINHYF